MKKLVILLLMGVLLPLSWAGSDPAGAATTKWAVDGRQITVNGDPFMMQGVCYSPSPIGTTDSYQPFGDFFIDQWHTVTDRDLGNGALAAMRKSNINSLKMYGMFPYVKNSDYSNGATASHSDFLTSAYNGGVDPVYVWAAYPMAESDFDPFDSAANQATRATIASEYKTLATQLKDDPAVMGFVISNECNSVNTIHNTDFWTWINNLAGEIKKIAPDKLTMMCLVDDSMETVPAAEAAVPNMPNLDVWGINSYRGTQTSGFDNLFSTFESASSKPLVVSEFGAPASDHDADGKAVLQPNNAQDQSDYIKTHWQDIAANSDVCAGGYVFEWNDEWWKVNNMPIYTHDASTAPGPGFPGNWWDEEWFGINGVKVSDRRNPKDAWNPGQPNPADTLVPRQAVTMLHDLWK